MQIINDNTHSLCDICCEEVPAKTFENDGKVYLSKTCSKHGEFTHLIEKDPDYYKKFSHIGQQGQAFYNTLVIPVTYRCNLNCKYCYAPHTNRPDMTLDEIKTAIKNNESKEIGISGGEPTLRGDLEQIISIVKAEGKKMILLTNGLKLADPEYLKCLKNAGLDEIFFSLDSFDPDFYNKFKGSEDKAIDLLKLKMTALNNIEKETIRTLLSTTIYPNSNDREIKDIFLYAFKKSHFIKMLRLRSCTRIGRNSNNNEDGYFGSELVNLFANAVGIDAETLFKEYLSDDAHTPYHVLFSLKGFIKKDKFIPKSSISNANLLQKLLPGIFKPQKLNKLQVRTIYWPTIKTIDLGELEKGIGHISKNNKAINFCLAINLDNKN